ncbi:beta family protein, partial [Vibrio anguillarum]
AKFVARVDYPTPATWIFERRRQVKDRNAADVPREKLYSRAARGIVTSESWDDSLDVWGAKIIREAANNQLEKFGTPAKWISVRL